MTGVVPRREPRRVLLPHNDGDAAGLHHPEEPERVVRQAQQSHYEGTKRCAVRNDEHVIARVVALERLTELAHPPQQLTVGLAALRREVE